MFMTTYSSLVALLCSRPIGFFDFILFIRSSLPLLARTGGALHPICPSDTFNLPLCHMPLITERAGVLIFRLLIYPLLSPLPLSV
jgi:hypothetical protein